MLVLSHGAQTSSFCRIIAMLCIGVLAFPTYAEPIVFRIGTGGSAGTYHPIGSLIAESISHAKITIAETDQDNDAIVAIAQRSNGSVANVTDLQTGLLEGALSQADVTYWAFNGQGPFELEAPKNAIRAIASLYNESLHLVVKADSDIKSVRDLAGLRVSIDELGSGTLFDVRPLLTAYEIDLSDIKAVYLKPEDAIDRFRQNQLDAFFIMAGYPVSTISELVNEKLASVVPIDGREVDLLIDRYPFFTSSSISVGTYQNTSKINTLAVAAQLIVNSDIDAALVYGITKSLWSDSTQNRLSNGHPKGKKIQLKQALAGISIPLHPGAIQYYSEIGVDLSTIPLASE